MVAGRTLTNKDSTLLLHLLINRSLVRRLKLFNRLTNRTKTSVRIRRREDTMTLLNRLLNNLANRLRRIIRVTFRINRRNINFLQRTKFTGRLSNLDRM